MSRKNGFIKEWLRQTGCRFLALRWDSEGFVLMSSLAIFLLLFLFCSSIYAIGETIHQRIKLQNACDAAAYSAAVIQADGLSRMASINRAMSWTYVQMTNRQMDYITYRWLKLTCQQFAQDLQNAKEFQAQLVLPLDKELTAWGMIIEAIVALVVQSISSWFDAELTCYGKNSNKNHKDEGLAYWCGLGKGTEHRISLNGLPPDYDLSLSGTWDKLVDTVSQRFVTKDNIDKVLNVLKYLFDLPNHYDSSNPEDWGGMLGKLIDYDKLNIKMMNNALPMINELMTLSMKVSSENILKSSLKDRRMENNDVLKDYHVSINIPHGENPYDSESVTDAPKSYFSALHNTEVDEMLFLNMHSSDNVGGSLPSFFPTLTGGQLAYGLDHWFIRGRGVYENSDNEEACYKSPGKASYNGSQSGWVDDSVRLTATERSDGVGGVDFGIQRVYKDTNLNETKAGFFMGKSKKHPREVACVRAYSKKKGVVSTYWGESELYSKLRQNPDNLTNNGKILQGIQETKEYIRQTKPACCYEHLHVDIGNIMRSKTKSAHTYFIVYIIDEHHTRNVSHNPVSRGNHIVNFQSLLEAVEGVAKSFMSGNDSSDDSEIDDPFKDIDNEIANCDKEIAALEAKKALAGTPEEKAALQEAINEKRNDKKELEDARQEMVNRGITSSSSSGSSASGAGASNEGSSGNGQSSSGNSIIGEAVTGLMSLLTDFLGELLGDALDVQASCGNSASLEYAQYPMCRTAGDDTYALYSQYRWASAKWYCMTNLPTYFICLIFKFPKIYCDMSKDKIPILHGLVSLPVKGKGHWHLPKWFCGTKPASLGDIISERVPELVDALGGKYFIPLPMPKTLEGSIHGYMELNTDFKNMFKPIGQLFGSVERNERDEFQSCVPFLDGNIVPTPVEAAFAGFIQGHARVYGDDKRIFDNRYVGAKCKPWVLNERFFAGKGTIVIGAAMKHRNPFVQLFDFLNRQYTEEQNLPEGSLLSAYNIPKGNVMWTMSAARAGVRRHRRNGLYDQERQYQITYDPTSDVENLEYKNAAPYYFHPETKGENKGSWKKINMNMDVAWDVDEPDNKLALSRPDIEGQQTDAIWNGCPCGGGNATAFMQMWNLCEWDWDATLIPLRYASIHARLKLEEEAGRPLTFAGERLDKLCYNDRRKTITEIRMTSNKNQELKSEKLRQLANNDDYIGDGRHWVWDMDMLLDLTACSKQEPRDPFTSSVWKRADASFFEEVAVAAAQGVSNTGAAWLNNTYQEIDLKTKLPQEKDSEINAELRYLMLLRSNRIL